MSVLSQKMRDKYATVHVDGKAKYPVNDKNHARLALAMINRGGLSKEQKLTVIRRAHQMLNSK